MVARRISSLQHPIVKHVKKIKTDRRYRKECGTVLIFGKKMIQEVSQIFSIKKLFWVGEKPQKIVSEEDYCVTEEIFKKISGMKNPEFLAAEVLMPRQKPLANQKFLLALDQVSDPGNLGTLFRSALAFGVEGIFLLEGSVDPLNDKALRAAKGATFYVPFFEVTIAELQKIIQSHSYQVYVGDISGENFEEVSFRFPMVLILGGESKGLTNEAKQLGVSISIPMKPQVESLNVGVAGSILLQQIGRKYGSKR